MYHCYKQYESGNQDRSIVLSKANYGIDFEEIQVTTATHWRLDTGLEDILQLIYVKIEAACCDKTVFVL
jgi:hypothetical protein